MFHGYPVHDELSRKSMISAMQQALAETSGSPIFFFHLSRGFLGRTLQELVRRSIPSQFHKEITRSSSSTPPSVKAWREQDRGEVPSEDKSNAFFRICLHHSNRALSVVQWASSFVMKPRTVQLVPQGKPSLATTVASGF